MTDQAASIVEAEARRCAAMLAGDLVALDAILDPRLSFAHATGLTDDKAAYLTKMAGGRIDYISIGWSDQSVISLGDDTALLTGVMTSDVKVEGIEKRLDNRVLMAWTRSDDRWCVVAFQSTPLKR